MNYGEFAIPDGKMLDIVENPVKRILATYTLLQQEYPLLGLSSHQYLDSYLEHARSLLGNIRITEEELREVEKEVDGVFLSAVIDQSTIETFTCEGFYHGDRASNLGYGLEKNLVLRNTELVYSVGERSSGIIVTHGETTSVGTNATGTFVNNGRCHHHFCLGASGIFVNNGYVMVGGSLAKEAIYINNSVTDTVFANAEGGILINTNYLRTAGPGSKHCILINYGTVLSSTIPDTISRTGDALEAFIKQERDPFTTDWKEFRRTIETYVRQIKEEQ